MEGKSGTFGHISDVTGEHCFTLELQGGHHLTLELPGGTQGHCSVVRAKE